MLRAPERGLEFLPEPGTRVAVGALVALLEDHGAFRLDRVGRDQRPGEAVGLHAHDQRQAGGLDGLVVGGDVARGEGVVLPALPRHGEGQGPGRDIGAALEHHVLEEMRGAAAACGILPGAGSVEQVVADHRHPAAFGQHHAQAVRQGPGGGAEQRAVRPPAWPYPRGSTGGAARPPPGARAKGRAMATGRAAAEAMAVRRVTLGMLQHVGRSRPGANPPCGAVPRSGQPVRRLPFGKLPRGGSPGQKMLSKKRVTGLPLWVRWMIGVSPSVASRPSAAFSRSRWDSRCCRARCRASPVPSRRSAGRPGRGRAGRASGFPRRPGGGYPARPGGRPG